MTKEYTLDQFEIEFENSTLDKKRDVLMNALSLLNMEDPEVSETLTKYREELKDMMDQMAEEENLKCIKDIESGTLELVTCVKDIDTFQSGNTYYVKVIDIASEYRERGADINELMSSYISNIKPIIWVYGDNGIGTLKYRTVFNTEKFNFSDYFKK